MYMFPLDAMTDEDDGSQAMGAEAWWGRRRTWRKRW
jgi:hypothetical protein